MALRLALKDVRVHSLDVAFHEISWQIVDTREDVLDYTFQVLRSESPSGPFDPLSVPFTDRYIYIDNTVQVAHRWRKYFYVVSITHSATGESEMSAPVTSEPDPDLIAIELRRHMQLLFREFAGRRTWVLPARTFGQRCECWNVAMQKRTRSGCRTCFDTGFVRGFLSPIEVWLQIDPSPKASQQTNVGELQQVNTTGRVGYYPAQAERSRGRTGESSLAGDEGLDDRAWASAHSPGARAPRDPQDGHRIRHPAQPRGRPPRLVAEPSA